MSKKKVDRTAKDEDQRLYRDYFNITDMYLIQYNYDPEKKVPIKVDISYS